MANTLRFKRGLVSTIPTALAGEPLFTTDTFDLYIGNGTGNTRFQKYIASGTTSQLLRGDGSLLTMPIVLTSPANGQVLKFNGTNWVNDSDAGITGSGAAGQVAYFTGATTQSGSNNLFWDNSTNRLGINTNTPSQPLHVISGGITTANFAHTGTDGAIDIRNTGTLAITRSSQIRLLNGSTFFGASDRTYQLTNIGRSASAADFYIQYWDGTNYFDRFRIFSTGNVGINTGTSDNGLRFQVTGDGFFSGAVAIGDISLRTRTNLTVWRNITGDPTSFGIYNRASIQSGVTTEANMFVSVSETQAASFTLAALKHYRALNAGFGAGSTVTNQFGFIAEAELIGATNNFGFYGNIASGTGRWNLYCNGTAANYLNGNTGLGILPSAWGTTNSVRALQLTSGSIWNFATTGFYIGQNNFFDGTNRVYVNTNLATEYAQITGSHIWYNAPSGTAGATISFIQGMRLYPTSNLVVGSGADAGFRLDVNGTMRVSGNGTMTNAVLTGGGTSLVTGTGLFSKSVIQVFDGGSASTNVDKIADLVLVNNTSFTDGIVGRVIGVNTNPALTEKRIAQIMFQIDGDTRAGQIILGTTNSASVFNNHLTIRATGAATFSSSVTAASFNGTTNNIFSTGGIEQMRLNSSGQLGLGAIPYAWGGSYKSFDFLFGSIANTNGGNVDVAITQNAFFNGTNWISKYTGASKRYVLSDGGHIWFNGASATSGTAITMTQAMTLDSSGRLLLGSGSVTSELLQVNGTMRVSGASTFGGFVTINNSVSAALNQNATTYVAVTNTDVGINTKAEFQAFSRNGGTTRFGRNSNLTTAYKILNASDGYVLNETLGDFAILNDNASGSIKMAAGASATPQFTIASTGAATFSGTVTISGGNGYQVINSAATTVTALRPTGGGSSIMSTNSNGLHIAVGTQAAGDLILASNNTERIRLSQNGFFSQLNATNPSASITDSYIQYSADVTAGNAAPHFRTENGAVIKLYQETTAVGNAIIGTGGGNAVLDDTTFDGYTLRQLVRALRNQGILQ